MRDSIYELSQPVRKLTDEQVYVVTKRLSTKQQKAWNWSRGFNRAGDIKLGHVSLDLTLVFIVFDIAYISLYKSYYILAGQEPATRYGTND